jgi:hypothetical protein
MELGFHAESHCTAGRREQRRGRFPRAPSPLSCIGSTDRPCPDGTRESESSRPFRSARLTCRGGRIEESVPLLAKAQALGHIGRSRRRGRVAEGGGLLNRYTLSRRIEGSNPSVSAILPASRPTGASQDWEHKARSRMPSEALAKEGCLTRFPRLPADVGRSHPPAAHRSNSSR